MFKSTNEQNLILVTLKAQEKIVKINAFAGTGKTTTLVTIAKEFTKKRILYLAFNKSIQLEAEAKFPSNTTVKTTHALAYGQIVYKQGYGVPRNNYRSREIAELFFVDENIAKLALIIFENFCNSASSGIGVDDVDIGDSIQAQAKICAKMIFDRMLKKDLQITHSFYLKAFHLGLLNGVIKMRAYDLIMLDEAQDTNDVTLSIFYNLSAKQKIIVGDRHQQIYSFRGSVNAMKNVKAKILNLTQSFRFNSEIARTATFFLNIFKDEKNIIKGTDKDIENKTKAYISRTNTMLIKEIAKVVKDEVFFKTVREPYSIFGLSLNILKLANGKIDKIDRGYGFLKYYYRDFINSGREEILSFLKERGEELDDVELITAAQIVGEFWGRIKDFYKIAMKNYESKGECDLFFTTAHTSKGLEWDEVEVMEDFDIEKTVAKYFVETGFPIDEQDLLSLFREGIKDGSVKQDIIDELNLYYVAITRARNSVVDNSKLYDKLLEEDEVGVNMTIEKIAIDMIEKEEKSK